MKPTYFDPVELEESSITNDTVLYLIRMAGYDFELLDEKEAFERNADKVINTIYILWMEKISKIKYKVYNPERKLMEGIIDETDIPDLKVSDLPTKEGLHQQEVQKRLLSIISDRKHIQITKDTFCIKASSYGLEQLASDPTTNITKYWILDTQAILDNQANHDKIFPNNRLTEAVLDLDDVYKIFEFNPNETTPNKFSKDVLGFLPGALEAYFMEVSNNEDLSFNDDEYLPPAEFPDTNETISVFEDNDISPRADVSNNESSLRMLTFFSDPQYTNINSSDDEAIYLDWNPDTNEMISVSRGELRRQGYDSNHFNNDDGSDSGEYLPWD